MIVHELHLVCTSCNTALEYVDGPKDHTKHRHVRCKKCSPAGWMACLSIKVKER